MDILLEKKMNIINDNKYSQNYKELIDTLTQERIALAKDFKYTCIVNDCWGAFFQLQYAIYQYKENCNNYCVLTNLKECSHFYIDNYQFPDDLNENNDIDIIIERRKAISDYLAVRPKEGIKHDKKYSEKALFLSERRERISNRTASWASYGE